MIQNMKMKKKEKRNNNNGTALAASGNGVFKGRCHICRKWEHNRNQCPYRNNRNMQNRQTRQNMSTSNNPTNTNCNTNSTPNPKGNNTNKYVPSRKSRFQGKCNHCRKWGHSREGCSFLGNNQFRNAERANICMPVAENIPQNRVVEEVVLINKMCTVRNEESGLNEIRNNIWIADSGASSHMTNDA